MAAGNRSAPEPSELPQGLGVRWLVGNRADVVAMTEAGASVDEVVGSLPSLTRAQVYECLAIYEDHQCEIDPLVAAQTAHLDE